MKLHKEGKKIIGFYPAFLLVLSIVVFAFLNLLWLKLLIVLPFLILFGFILWFFRIPNRPLPTQDNKVIAPADGKVVVIEKTSENEYLKEERIQVSIFMSPLNIHQNVWQESPTPACFWQVSVRLTLTGVRFRF